MKCLSGVSAICVGNRPDGRWSVSSSSVSRALGALDYDMLLDSTGLEVLVVGYRLSEMAGTMSV